MKRSCAVFTVLILLFSPVLALAAEAIDDNPELLTRRQRMTVAVEKYGAKVGSKIDYGMPNMLMGWTQIFTEPQDHRQTTGAKWRQALSTVGCVFVGAGLAVVDTAGGFVNILTSPVPVTIPLPRGGVDAARLSSGKKSS